MLSAVRTACTRVASRAVAPTVVRALSTQFPYLPHTDEERKAMLDVIGAKSVDEFFECIPEAARLKKPLDLPPPKSEVEIMKEMQRMSDKNVPASRTSFFMGAGYYRHHLPTVVDHLIQRSEILTAYTPYQPEVAQGTLQVLFEFQTQVAMLTGMEVANASMYDGPTACSEAVLMARRIKNKRPKIVLSGGLHPHYSGVVNTLMEAHDSDCRNILTLPANLRDEEDILKHVDDKTAAVVVQNPDVFGRVRDLKPLADAVHKKGALLVATFAEAFSLGMLKSPGSMGADIVIGEGQSLGSPLSFGGPSVGIMATKAEYMRQIPGRLIGQTVDAEGRRSWCLALGTREQHIRREKATSNICTSSGVCATAFSMHLACLGEVGFTQYAQLNHANASILAERIKKEVPTAKVLNKTFFNEFALELNTDAEKASQKLLAQGVLGGVPCSRLFGTKEGGLDKVMLVACTELTTKEDMDKLIAGLKKL